MGVEVTDVSVFAAVNGRLARTVKAVVVRVLIVVRFSDTGDRLFVRHIVFMPMLSGFNNHTSSFLTMNEEILVVGSSLVW